MSGFAESEVESVALGLLESLGYTIKHGLEIAPGEPAAERTGYGQVVLERRLRDALVRLNPELPAEALKDAFRKVLREEGATLEASNRAFHRMLADGITVEHRRRDGSIACAQVWLIDFDAPENNDWHAINQFTVSENKHTRRPDVVLFVNGLPLGVIELKNPADEDATIWTAFQQLQTSKQEIPAFFALSEALVVPDGVEARLGTLTARREWHTQGSGKSLTMAFYAGRVIREPRMENPTLVVLTDRKDLDGQLLGTFSRCQDLLRQPPVQAESRADLREKLRVEAGGVVFTTIQEFLPEEKGDRHPVLSERRNIVVIADEAHRSQYDFIDGFARHMRDALPNAAFIGFTGTPIELIDKNTRRCSATISACTTSSAPCKIGRPSRSTTRAALRSWSWTRPSGRGSTPSSRR